jgi:hypothetical protein
MVGGSVDIVSMVDYGRYGMNRSNNNQAAAAARYGSF